MRIIQLVSLILIIHVVVSLALVFFSPSLISPAQFTVGNVLLTLKGLPFAWFEGAMLLPDKLEMLWALLSQEPKKVIITPMFWASLVGVMLSLYLFLMWFFSSRTTKIVLFILISITLNIMVMEALLISMPVLQPIS